MYQDRAASNGHSPWIRLNHIPTFATDIKIVNGRIKGHVHWPCSYFKHMRSIFKRTEKLRRIDVQPEWARIIIPQPDKIRLWISFHPLGVLAHVPPIKILGRCIVTNSQHAFLVHHNLFVPIQTRNNPFNRRRDAIVGVAVMVHPLVGCSLASGWPSIPTTTFYPRTGHCGVPLAPSFACRPMVGQRGLVKGLLVGVLIVPSFHARRMFVAFVTRHVAMPLVHHVL